MSQRWHIDNKMRPAMKKVAFVSPWYGENIPGGAEAALRGMAHHLQNKGVDIEILTTCVHDFSSDWNENYYKPGVDLESGVPVRRFEVKARNEREFDRINAKLMANMSVSRTEEETFIREMVNSPDLYSYIKEKEDDYQCFLYMPYMFGTTYYGILSCPSKAVLIPCFHDEAYLYMSIYKNAFERTRGVVYLSEAEKEIAHHVYNFSKSEEIVVGTGIDTNIQFNARRFRKKYDIENPFILYAGRKDEGKNIYLLLRFFQEYKLRHKDSTLKLVLIGGGDVSIPSAIQSSVLELGYVNSRDKYDAYAAATFLCQPSIHESFSIVIMESWLCGRPVLVHNQCAVTRSFAVESNGGLFFENYHEFEMCTDYFLSHPMKAEILGKQGKRYVCDNYDWEIVTGKLVKFVQAL